MSASSMKSIKNRIKSIKGTMQITKAMELVAVSKMRKAAVRIEKSKPYFNILHETLEDIARDNRDFSSVYTRKREGRTCHIIIAGDRGLAGGYNSNLFKSLDVSKDDIILPIGKKVLDFFAGYDIYTDSYSRAEWIQISDCHNMGKSLSKSYLDGEFTRLIISYTSYINMLTQEPKTVSMLPVKIDGAETKKYSFIEYEPDAETAFAQIIPYYLSGMIYGAVSESVASELSARRNAMESATDNAAEMINSLSLEYNRARQASITRELTEIVAGAENLNQKD